MKHHSFACVHHREYQEIIMEKDKTYVENILDPEFSEDDHSRLYSKKPKSYRMTMRKT
jgi:hypothetical protein